MEALRTVRLGALTVYAMCKSVFFFFSSRRRHTRWNCEWSSDVCSSDLFGWFMKNRFLKNKMPAGFQLPGDAKASFFPPVSNSQEGLEILRKAVARLQTERMTARHPVLGGLTHDEWMQLHLRHSELHL